MLLNAEADKLIIKLLGRSMPNTLEDYPMLTHQGIAGVSALMVGPTHPLTAQILPNRATIPLYHHWRRTCKLSSSRHEEIQWPTWKLSL